MSLMARLANSGRSLWKFMREVSVELKRVVWPTRRQTLVYTGVVLAAVVFISVLLYVVDSAIGYVFRWLLGAA